MGARKEKTVAEADALAKEVKTEQKIFEAIIAEAVKLYRGEEHSVQQLFAYCRELDRKGKLPQKKEEKKAE